MNKKSYISVLFLVAFAVLFMHSVIPHHHDEEEKITHQARHHDDHEDLDHNPLSHAFGSFHHEQGGIVYESSSPTFQYCKVNIDKEVALLIQHFTSLIEKPPLIHTEHYLFYPVFSPYPAPKLFRGPPSVKA